MYACTQVSVADGDPSWVRVLAKRVGHFGMYGADKASEGAYVDWVHENGSDPWYDDVLADEYMLAVHEGKIFKVLARYPYVRGPRSPASESVPDEDPEYEAYSLELSACS
jgi:hypothetical protein